MSISDNISSWKHRAEIDYFSIFIPLWLAFDSWFKDKYGEHNQRDCIETLKNDEINNKTYHKFKSLINGTDSISENFKSNFKQLNEALESAPIYYECTSNNSERKIVSFKNALVDRENGEYEDLFRQSKQHDKIELVEGVYLTDEIPKIYKGYIEILYQVRCRLFHGNFSPNKENERTVKLLYLTLKDLIDEI